ncbi:hypothetical protein ACHAQJ_006704 [Trichoderma viride]
MSSTSGSTGGTQRASEINNAMLNVPGYADDSLLFMMRYGTMAKADVVLNRSGTPPAIQETLRKVDWDEFQRRLHAMNAHWLESKRKTQSQSESSSSSAAVVVGCRGTGQGDGANTAASRHSKDSPPTGDDDNAVDPSPEPETEPEAAELKARTLELVQDFPHLVRDFDRFVECTRMMAARYKR